MSCPELSHELSACCELCLRIGWRLRRLEVVDADDGGTAEDDEVGVITLNGESVLGGVPGGVALHEGLRVLPLLVGVGGVIDRCRVLLA